jgi:phage terminase Nu1 subunit (DNA packaging protein)
VKYTYAKSQTQLAKAVGIPYKKLRNLIENGAPCRKYSRGYRVESFKKWLSSQGRDPKRKGKVHAKFEDARARERAAKAELAEMELAKRRGEYMPMDVVKERDLYRISIVRQGLLSLPKAIAGVVTKMTPAEAEKEIERRVRELLIKFSEA